jgi:biopolymer transport protein ExbD
MVVFLLKNYSAQGQLVTPAQDLRLPVSSVERMAAEALTVKVSQKSIMVENETVVDGKAFSDLQQQKDFKIGPLFDVLREHAREAEKSSQLFHTEFSGRISIQGDVEIPYSILTKIMYTCGQAGFPVMNLVVYRRG